MRVCVRVWWVVGVAMLWGAWPTGGRSVRQTSGSRSVRPHTQQEEFSVPQENLLPEAGPGGPTRLLLDPEERRLVRSAEDGEESTFSQSYESDWVTTPQDTDITERTLSVATTAWGQEGEDAGHHGNSSIPPGLFRPYSPLEEGSAAGYAMLGLGALVLALGVVGNMAVMCVVWNNYYMRSAWNYLLASMAFWDFLVLVFCLPVVVLNQLSHRRILSEITCRMVPYMEVGGALA